MRAAGGLSSKDHLTGNNRKVINPGAPDRRPFLLPKVPLPCYHHSMSVPILTTKLFIPRTRPGTVDRARLVAWCGSEGPAVFRILAIAGADTVADSAPVVLSY